VSDRLRDRYDDDVTLAATASIATALAAVVAAVAAARAALAREVKPVLLPARTRRPRRR
jgi:hypothetical protein